MKTLILDIETVGEKYDDMDDATQGVLSRWIERTSKSEESRISAMQAMKDGFGLSPLTGEVVAIGMLDLETDKKIVYFQAPGEEYGEYEEDGVLYKQKNEAQMLQDFWEGISKYRTLVTFNGRMFDVPFLMIRSAIHKIRPTKNFMGNRYLNYQSNSAEHVDLQDLLAFYGAMQRKGSLHLWCRAFGIKSPKDEGVTGDDVGKLFYDKNYKDIARYNVRDIEATRDLYLYWDTYLRFGR